MSSRLPNSNEQITRFLVVTSHETRHQETQQSPTPLVPENLHSATLSRHPLSHPNGSKIPYSTVSSRAAQDLLAEVEREKQREREQRKRAGLDTKDIDQEDEEDYMGVMPLIEKLEKEKLKDSRDLNLYEEPTDSDSDEDDERFTPDAVKKRFDEF
ncbi:hypothetical protein ACFX2J_014885 [Malus domestica]